jgi:hypothetical protein
MTATSTPIQVPLINGVVYSFAHITMQIAGLEFTGGFKSIKYARKRNREMVYSNSPDPVGKTLGQNEYSASVEVYFAWWLAVLKTIEANLGPGYGDQSFPTYVRYANNGFDPCVDEILNCNFDTTDADNQAGTTALTRMIDLSPTKILFNGVDDLANPLVAAAQ